MNMVKRVSAVLIMIFIFVTVLITSYASDSQTIEYNAAEIFEKTQKTCFYIKTYDGNDRVENYGSGYFISSDGLALTAYHVIKDATRINVMFADRSTMQNIKVVYSEYSSDIAILKLDVKDVNYLELEQNMPKHGEKIFALGYPFREAKIITEGIVSNPSMAINENQRMLISAPLVNGMSGGPIINEIGNAVGIAFGSLITMPNLYVSATTQKINEKINEIKEGK